ncbi:hypothetical protein KIW84_065584 [Lathyrus oleraceus]|uniref:DUF7745 domain-containing protein n=1 Tax=Pisum sativum TaxID=3888 RepID=A0A9D5A7N3_PEA|nr:hypothetical protein KIW84_065584 [Pisum sativum]
MHVQMVTFCSVDQSSIYKSDLWPFIAETPECCPSYLSVGIRLFQDSPGRFRWLWVSAQRLMMMMMYLCSVYFGTLEMNLWLHSPSDGCDRFSGPGCGSEDILDQDPGREISCSDMRTGLKRDVAYSFFDPEIGVLKEMIALITPDHVGMFRESYGSILKMVFRLTDSDRSAIHTFLQFYDPGLRCFIFPDYLLGPLMEDYASILGMQIRDQIPFHVTRVEPDVLGISRALYLSPEMVVRPQFLALRSLMAHIISYHGLKDHCMP